MIHRENTTRFIDILNEFKISDFDFIFDIGAGWGFESEQFGQIFSDKSIFSFECNPDSIVECQKNIKSKNISLITNSICDFDGVTDFYPCTNGNIGASSMYMVSDDYYKYDPLEQNLSIKVQSMRLETFIESNRLENLKGIIWMDLQGAELRALKGLGKYLKNISLIWTEAQYKPIYEGVNTFDEINQFLNENGYILVYPNLQTIRLHKETDEWWSDFCYIKNTDINFKYLEKKVYSQNGEDGLIEFISNQLKPINYFVEIGVQESESNCLLLKKNQTNGLFIDSDSQVDWIKKELVSRENILQILDKYQVPEKFEFLSIDIDYNTYWVLKSIVDSKIYDIDFICVEYNGDLGYEDSLVVDYNPFGKWDGTIFYGASLKTFSDLLSKHGYRLIYCEENGVNAFFSKNVFPFDEIEISNVYKELSVNHLPTERQFLDCDYYEVLKNYEFKNKIRFGNNFDGGYVIADVDDYDCYISAGIGDDESFSEEIINKYNIQNLFAFDGNIVNLPYNFPDKLNYTQKNINIFNDDYNTDLVYLLENYCNIFLKMDIEGFEVEWFDKICSRYLYKIKQMVVEFHSLDENKHNVIRVFEKINQTHYLIHSHGNNNDYVKNKIPNVIELTFIRKELIDVVKLNKNKLPSELDFPNNKNKEEIDLNFEPFVQLSFRYNE